MEYWKALLIEWQAKRKTGLTIPYLIGSQNYLKGSDRKDDIGALLASVVNNPDTLIVLKYCASPVEDTILGIEGKADSTVGFFPTWRGKQQSKLFVKSRFVHKDLGETVEEISRTLSDRYEYYINEGNYSKNDRVRGDFLEEEKEFIRTTFKKYFEGFKESK